MFRMLNVVLFVFFSFYAMACFNCGDNDGESDSLLHSQNTLAPTLEFLASLEQLSPQNRQQLLLQARSILRGQNQQHRVVVLAALAKAFQSGATGNSALIAHHLVEGKGNAQLLAVWKLFLMHAEVYPDDWSQVQLGASSLVDVSENVVSYCKPEGCLPCCPSASWLLYGQFYYAGHVNAAQAIQTANQYMLPGGSSSDQFTSSSWVIN